MYEVIISNDEKVIAIRFKDFDDALDYAEFYLACFQPIHIQIDFVEGKREECLMWAITASNKTTDFAVVEGEPALRLRHYGDILYRSALYDLLPESRAFLNKTTGEILSPSEVKAILDKIYNSFVRWYGPEGGTQVIVRENFVILGEWHPRP